MIGLGLQKERKKGKKEEGKGVSKLALKVRKQFFFERFAQRSKKKLKQSQSENTEFCRER